MTEQILLGLVGAPCGLGIGDFNLSKLFGGSIPDVCPCCGHKNMHMDTHGPFRRVKKCECFRNSGGACACGVEEDDHDVIHVDNSHHHEKVVVPCARRRNNDRSQVQDPLDLFLPSRKRNLWTKWPQADYRVHSAIISIR